MRLSVHILNISLAITVALMCPTNAKPPTESQSPWDFAKGINKVRPAAKTYTLHDKLTPMRAETTVNKSSVRYHVLANGLKILVQEVPYDDVVAIEVLFKCGVFQEESNLAGYTNFIVEMLLERLNSENGEDVAEITGSVVDSGLTPDLARLSIVTSSRYREYWMGRLCNALSKTQFTEAEVESVRSRLLVVLAERGGGFEQLYEIFLSQFYRYHPYKRSIFGNKAVVKKATPESLNEFYSHHFSSDNIVISTSGMVNAPEFINFFKKRLSGLQPHPEQNIAIQWEPQAQDKETYLSSSANNAWVLVGYPAPPAFSADYAAMRIATSAIGSGLSSRLWMELREKRGLAYELSGRYPELSGPSHFLCYAVCKATSSGEVRRRIIGEVKRFREEGIGEQELEDTRNMLIGDYLLKRETNMGRALYVGTAEALGPNYQADSQYLQDLRNVTVADVNRVAKRYLIEPNLLVARPGGRFYIDW